MKKENEIIHVYFMPGMAANPSIFENIILPQDKFKTHYLKWSLPHGEESLESYSKRLAKKVTHEDSVLIGVSFGGVIVQEMSKFLKLRRLIIISSVKTKYELPRRMRYSAKTGLYHLLPTGLLDYIDHLEKIAVNDFLKKRANLYRKYLSVRNTKYLNWAIKEMVCWQQEKPIENIVHIHGDKDLVFPYKYINGCITVKGGTHIMIINRYRWFNEYLPELIISGKFEKQKI